MEAANQATRDYKGPVTAAWLMIGLTCLVALVPGVGFLTWFIGGPILLITFILGIVILSKGGTLQGVLVLLMSLIVAPVFLLVAPILTTSLMAGSGEGAGGRGESKMLDSNLEGEAPQDDDRNLGGDRADQNAPGPEPKTQGREQPQPEPEERSQ